MPDRGIPARYVDAWETVSNAAARRRVAVEVRIHPGSEVEDDGTVLRGRFDLYLRNRGEAASVKVGSVETFDQAIADLATVVAKEPLPGPDALRDELRAFGRRLALIQPRDVAKPRGADVPIYRDFRDRILPLAWDNLVESVRVEALEDFVRRVGALSIAGASDEQTVRDLAAEARGLVAPKESGEKETGGEVAATEPEQPAEGVRPARARARRTKPTG